jgi:hypothetical protein
LELSLSQIIDFENETAVKMLADFFDSAYIHQKRTVESQESQAQFFFQTFQRKTTAAGRVAEVIACSFIFG